MTAEGDARWMQRALRLAARGQGRTSPNPMVGAVVVQKGELVGEGYHREVGGPHAEVWALRQAGDRARGGTIYVTLEPCSHHGRTPPCADALVQAGLGRVVAAMVDPNPRVSGAGLERLREAGIEVEVGVLEGEARRLNAAYIKHTVEGLPLVSLKAAMSLDGKIATASRESRWITGERARAVGHRLRAMHDAVMVGMGTVLADDPRLTVRQARGRTPRRVVVDSKGRTPTEAAVLKADQIPVIIAVTEGAPEGKTAALRGAGAEVIEVSSRDGRVDLQGLMQDLASRQIQSVLVEGGGTLAEGLLAAGLVDRVYFFIAPKIIGGATAPTPVDGAGIAELSQAWRLERVQVRRVGEDILISGDVAR
jgi:diaminohydroxyphosphoribosylaminopyrimidine deaminase/5-amino-6-(5-phosphoribosylamino)uracil reductase